MAWKLISQGNNGYQEWQLDEASDIQNPPLEAQKAGLSSKAWTGDLAHIYNKKNDGSWFDILAEE